MTDQPTPLATLVAEVDAAVQKMTPGPWRAFVRDIEQMSDGGKGYPLNVYPDCATVHVGHPTVDDERTGNVGLRRQEDIDGIVALVNAWPAVKEGIERLQAWKVEALAVEAQWDVQAVGRAIGAPLGSDIRPLILPAIERLRALVVQQREALRIVLNRAEQLFASDRPPPRACGRCGTPSAACDGDCADHAYIAQDLWKARAVLATEGDDHA